VLLETRGSAEVTSSAPKPLKEEPPSTSDADARAAEDMVNSILRDSPTPDTEKGGEKRPEEISTSKLLYLSPRILNLLCWFFVIQGFLQVLKIKRIPWRKLRRHRMRTRPLWWGPVLPLLQWEVPHHKQKS